VDARHDSGDGCMTKACRLARIGSVPALQADFRF